MLRRKIDDYIRHYYETTRNALLITGARQVGKTYSIRQFGRTFKSFVEINFVETPEAIELFTGAKSSSDILLRLSVITSTPLIKGETLIFLTKCNCVLILLLQSSFWWTMVHQSYSPRTERQEQTFHPETAERTCQIRPG